MRYVGQRTRIRISILFKIFLKSILTEKCVRRKVENIERIARVFSIRLETIERDVARFHTELRLRFMFNDLRDTFERFQVAVLSL